MSLLSVLRGQRACYIGSDTKVKRQKSPLALVNPDSLEKSAITLGQLLSWVGAVPNLGSLISTMIMEKTHTPPVVVSAAADSIAGGEFEHRGKVSVLVQVVHINFDPIAMSYIGITTDTALEFARKGGDFTIMFHMVKIASASSLIYRLMSGEEVSGTWGSNPGMYRLH